MKEFFNVNTIEVKLTIVYFDNKEELKYSHSLKSRDEESTKDLCGKYEGAYIKIKNALINKQDFVEIEL